MVVQERCAVVGLAMKSSNVVSVTLTASKTAFYLDIPAVHHRYCLCYTGAQAVLLACNLVRHCAVYGRESVFAAAPHHMHPHPDVVFWAKEMGCRPLLNMEKPVVWCWTGKTRRMGNMGVSVRAVRSTPAAFQGLFPQLHHCTHTPLFSR